MTDLLQVAQGIGCKVFCTVESNDSCTYVHACCGKMKRSDIFVSNGSGNLQHDVLRATRQKGMYSVVFLVGMIQYA